MTPVTSTLLTFFSVRAGLANGLGADAADSKPWNRPARHGPDHAAPLPARLLPVWCVAVELSDCYL